MFMALTLVNVCSLLLHRVLLPFADTADNHGETMTLFALCALSTTLTTASVPLSVGHTVAASLLVFPTLALCVARVARDQYREWKRKRALKRGERCEHYRLPCCSVQCWFRSDRLFGSLRRNGIDDNNKGVGMSELSQPLLDQ